MKVGRARGLVGGGEETASSWGRRAVVAVTGSPTHAAGVDYHLWGGGAERRWSAGCRASPTASVRDHVPVVHGDAAKCAKMEACVVCCVWTGVREGGNKLRDLTPESSSSYEIAWLAGYNYTRRAILKLIYDGLCVAT